MSDDRSVSFRFTIVLVLSFVCLPVPAWADGQAGMDAYKRGDHATALREWRPLAEQGDANAQYNLGVMYDFEKGVPQDFTTARRWYEKAAAQGHAGAQNNLGGLYEFGHGVTQDYVRAYMWYNVAADHSTGGAQKDVAAENRDEIAGRMTSAQIAEAQRLARRCQAQDFKGC
jgi:TPR repeat protein